MEDEQLRLEALIAAIKISPNNIAGSSEVVVKDAQAFYDFLKNKPESKTGAVRISLDPNSGPALSVVLDQYITGMAKAGGGSE